MFRSVFKKICLNTELHGYKFLVLHNNLPFERILWRATIFLATITSIIFIYITIMYSKTFGTALVTDSVNMPIWFYQFPAITICSFNQISKKSLLTIIQNWKTKQNMSEEVLTQLSKNLISIYPLYNRKYSIDDLRLLQDILEYNNETIENVIEKVRPNCNDSLRMCFWKNEKKPCSLIFKPIMTSFGLCCTFNMIAFKHQKNNINDKDFKPKRVSSCGGLTALHFLTVNKVNDYFSPIIPSNGNFILIHNSYEMPTKSDVTIVQYIRSFRQIGVTPYFTTMNEEIKNALKHHRKCLFKNEQKMKIFKQYTFQNCIYECRIQNIIDVCLCVPLHIKYISDEFNLVRTCNLRDIPCMKNSFYANCTCPRNCEYYKYTPSLSTTTFSEEHYYYNLTNSNDSLLEVSFTDLSAMSNKHIYYSPSSTFSFTGGILSVFTGFSFKAVLKMIYLVLVDFGKIIILQHHNNPIVYRN